MNSKIAPFYPTTNQLAAAGRKEHHPAHAPRSGTLTVTFASPLDGHRRGLAQRRAVCVKLHSQCQVDRRRTETEFTRMQRQNPLSKQRHAAEISLTRLLWASETRCFLGPLHLGPTGKHGVGASVCHISKVARRHKKFTPTQKSTCRWPTCIRSPPSSRRGSSRSWCRS